MAKISINIDTSRLYDFDGRLVDFVKEANRILESVPPEYREVSTIELSNGYYDSGYTLEARYVREQTAEEIEEERALAERYRAEQEQRDLREFMRLKSKFDN